MKYFNRSQRMTVYALQSKTIPRITWLVSTFSNWFLEKILTTFMNKSPIPFLAITNIWAIDKTHLQLSEYLDTNYPIPVISKLVLILSHLSKWSLSFVSFISIFSVYKYEKFYLSNTHDQQIQTRSCIPSSYGKSPPIHSLSAELPVPN